MNGYSVAIFPRSWHVGRWDRGTKKTLWAFGPFRFIKHRVVGTWKVNDLQNLLTYLERQAERGEVSWTPTLKR